MYGRVLTETLISVIITAYNRNEYLLQAVESALDQTLHRSKYEIIVVKNFSDPVIDGVLTSQNIKSVLVKDLSVGEFILMGLQSSEGNILCFLDDDDLFTKDKVQVIFDEFSANEQLNFFHNAFDAINKDGKKLNEDLFPQIQNRIEIREAEKFSEILGKLLKFSANINLSSMSVRRTLLEKNSEFLRRLTASTDNFVFFTAANFGKIMIFDSTRLTKYRIHESTSHTTADLAEAGAKNILHEEKHLASLALMLEMSADSPFHQFLAWRRIDSKITYHLFGGHKNLSFPEYLFYLKYGLKLRNMASPLYAILDFLARFFPLTVTRYYVLYKSRALKAKLRLVV